MKLADRIDFDRLIDYWFNECHITPSDLHDIVDACGGSHNDFLEIRKIVINMIGEGFIDRDSSPTPTWVCNKIAEDILPSGDVL